MRIQILLPALALTLSMLACNLPSSAPVTGTPTLSLLLSPTATLALPTAGLTQTPPPTNTLPPTIPPTSTVPVASPKDQNVNCRLGPGTAWVPLSALITDQSSQITGKSADGSWWLIIDPLNSGRKCWVSASVVNTSGNLAGIAVAETPTAVVTNITIRVDPKVISATSCAGTILPIKINATIETNGPTQVKWRFETQQGGAMPNQTAVFETFGERDFSVDYTPPVAAGTYWVKLVVISPNNLQAEESYRIECS